MSMCLPRRLRLARLPCLIAAALLAGPAQAATKSWACSDNFWHTATCWSPSGIPGAADDVTISPVFSANLRMAFNAASGTRSANSMVVNSATAYSATYVQSGGSLALAGTAMIANGGTGRFELNSGDFSASVFYLGYSGTGSATQGGGNFLTGSSFLYLAYNPGTVASFALSGGAATSLYAIDGVHGRASISQTAGSHTIGESLYLGYYSDANGSYALAGTGTLSARTAYVGLNGIGTFSQSAGSASFSESLLIGAATGGSGSYALSGTGQLQTPSLQVGAASTGAVIQSGGTLGASSSLVLGGGADGQGTYTLNAGTANTGYSYVGHYGEGSFVQTGGTHRIDYALVLGNQPGSSGSYALSGGTLSAGALQRGSGSAQFNWTGGTLEVRNGYTITGSAFLGSSLSLSAGRSFITSALTVDDDGGLYLYGGAVTATSLVNRSTVVLSDGALSVNTGSFDNLGSLSFAGGTSTGTGAVLNHGTIGGHGTLGGSGGFTNRALLKPGGGLLALDNTGVNRNEGIIELSAGNQLSVGNNLTNAGSLVLSGGALTGTGSVTNAAAGQIVGQGRITRLGRNDGLVGVSGGTLNLALNFANAGVIQLDGFGANLTGGIITNSGTVQGAGRIANQLYHNTGTVEAVGGTLMLASGADDNAAGGTLAAGAGAKLLVVGGLDYNDGLIQLDGGTFDNGGLALSSGGRIVGHGTLRSGGLVNTGQVALSFGNTTVSGAITNQAAGTLIVSNGASASFADALVNRGELRVSAGGAANFFGTVSGDGQFGGDGEVRFEGGFAPGNSPAVVTIGFQAIYGSGSTLTMELGGTTPGNCSTCADKIIFNNKVTLQGGALDVVWWGGHEGAAGEVFDLFDWNGPLSGSFGRVVLPTLGDGLAWQTGQLYATGEISIAAVPEPQVAALLAAGLAVLGWRLRRRRP